MTLTPENDAVIRAVVAFLVARKADGAVEARDLLDAYDALRAELTAASPRIAELTYQPAQPRLVPIAGAA